MPQPVPIKMSFDSLELYQRAKQVATEFGLNFQLEHGPKEIEPDTLEGLRIVTVWGLPERMNQMQEVFAVHVTRASIERQKQVHHLYRLWEISP